MSNLSHHDNHEARISRDIKAQLIPECTLIHNSSPAPTKSSTCSTPPFSPQQMDPTPLLESVQEGHPEISAGGSAEDVSRGEPKANSSGCNWALAGLSLGLVMLLLVLVMPAFALGMTSKGWLDAEKANISVGWNAIKGYKPCKFPSGDGVVTMWEKCIGEDFKSGNKCITELKKAGGVWKEAGILGGVLPAMFLIAVTCPLWLFLCVPLGCRAVFERKMGKDVDWRLWTNACGMFIWLMTGGIWAGMGTGIIAVTFQFIKAAETGVKQLAQTSFNVTCDGLSVCSAIRSPTLCPECAFTQDQITCSTSSGSTCSLSAVEEDCGKLCTGIEAGWAAWISYGTAGLLILVGLGLCLGFFLSPRLKSSGKNSDNDEEG